MQMVLLGINLKHQYQHRIHPDCYDVFENDAVVQLYVIVLIILPKKYVSDNVWDT